MGCRILDIAEVRFRTVEAANVSLEAVEVMQDHGGCRSGCRTLEVAEVKGLQDSGGIGQWRLQSRGAGV